MTDKKPALFQVSQSSSEVDELVENRLAGVTRDPSDALSNVNEWLKGKYVSEVESELDEAHILKEEIIKLSTEINAWGKVND